MGKEESYRFQWYLDEFDLVVRIELLWNILLLRKDTDYFCCRIIYSCANHFLNNLVNIQSMEEIEVNGDWKYH